MSPLRYIPKRHTISPSADSTYEQGQTVQLQALPDSNYVFTGWSGSVESTDNPLSITVDKTYGLTAHFKLKTYDLIVDTQGKGTRLSKERPLNALQAL